MVGVVRGWSNTGVATVTAAVALGLLSAPVVRHEMPIRIAASEVQLQAVATQIAALASTESAPVFSAATTSSSQTAYSAAETADAYAPLRTILALALSPITIPLAVIWFVSFPVTFPAYLRTLSTPIFLPAFALFGWATVPSNAVKQFIESVFPPPTQASTPLAASRQPLAANTQAPVVAPTALSAVPQVDTGSASTDAAAVHPKSEPEIQPTRASGRNTGPRPLGARTVTRPAGAEPALTAPESASAQRSATATLRAASASRTRKDAPPALG